MPLSTMAKLRGGTNISSASASVLSSCGGGRWAARGGWPLELSNFMVLAPK